MHLMHTHYRCSCPKTQFSMFASQSALTAGKQPAWAGAGDTLPYGVETKGGNPMVGVELQQT